MIVLTEPCERHVYVQLAEHVDLPPLTPEVLYHYVAVPPDLYSVVEFPDGTTFSQLHEDLEFALSCLPTGIVERVREALR